MTDWTKYHVPGKGLRCHSVLPYYLSHLYHKGMSVDGNPVGSWRQLSEACHKELHSPVCILTNGHEGNHISWMYDWKEAGAYREEKKHASA